MLTRFKKIVAEGAQRTGVYPYIRRRKFLAFCVGAPKTGTQSITDIFEDRYRSAHEPLWGGTMEILRAALRGEHSREEWKRILRKRDREMHLEMESSHFLYLFADLLPELFPSARFILTVRDPRSWLDSSINQDLNYPAHRLVSRRALPVDVFWHDVQNHYYRTPENTFHPAEAALEARRVPYTIDGYLAHWARHNRAILDHIPEDRLLIVRTGEIGKQVPRMARFVEVPDDTLTVDRSHTHKAPRKHGLLDKVDAEYLKDRLEHHCAATWALVQARDAAQRELIPV
jgi:hypothetical protein